MVRYKWHLLSLKQAQKLIAEVVMWVFGASSIICICQHRFTCVANVLSTVVRGAAADHVMNVQQSLQSGLLDCMGGLVLAGSLPPVLWLGPENTNMNRKHIQ